MNPWMISQRNLLPNNRNLTFDFLAWCIDLLALVSGARIKEAMCKFCAASHSLAQTIVYPSILFQFIVGDLIKQFNWPFSKLNTSAISLLLIEKIEGI